MSKANENNETLASGIIPEDLDNIAIFLIDSGLMPENHFRVSDKSGYLTKYAIAHFLQEDPKFESLGEGVDSLEGIGINRDPFLHPLLIQSAIADPGSKPDIHSGEWERVSFFINCAQGWDSENVDKVTTVREYLRPLFAKQFPTVNFDLMLFRSRYDDRALLKFASYLSQILEAKFG